MIPLKRLAAAVALGAGLAAAGAALAQTQTQTPNDITGPTDAAAQPALPPGDATTQQTDSRDDNQPTYSVPPPDSTPDRDLPTALGGYARSVAGCAVLGCDDDPQIGDAPGPLAPRPGETPPPPPVNAQPDQPR
jgi:hypothetical protein